LALLARAALPVQAVVAQHRYFLRFQPLVELAVMGHKTAAHLEIVLREAQVGVLTRTIFRGAVAVVQLR
jgi:hypothetical protein